LGGKGVAYDAKLVGRNILEGATDSNVAEALTSQTDLISISNNSWGAADGTGNYSSTLATSLWKNAIISGITTGRNGKGTLYFWAAGNGGYTIIGNTAYTPADNSNFDGQANYYGVLAICGVGEDGKRASYSEKGANLWVCAHTQGTNTGFTRAITTTDATGNKGLNSSSSRSDLSNKNYTKKFNGTSSAAPLASGVTALLLSKYPNLSWRDAREILAKSARKNDSTNSDWTTNTAGYNINHNYGFGTIDASRVMSTASTWSSITNPLITCETLSQISSSGQISFDTSILSDCNNITKIEFIEINFSTTASSTGTINIELFRSSTSGTKSILIESHLCASEGYPVDCQSGSNMGTSRHLGESVGNTWILEATPTSVTFTASLKFYGRIKT
jgi:kexin